MKTRIALLMLSLLLSLPLLAAAQEEEPSEALAYIQANAEEVGVLCYSSDGVEPVIEHNADQPFVLASTAKIIILAEFARQTAEGMIDPQEEVPLEDVNRYWVPGSDGGAQQMWIETLDGAETVTLMQVANAMIQFSSNAAPDYLLARLGDEGFPELYARLGLENTDLPIYYTGLLLALSNHEIGLPTPDEIAALDEETFQAEHDRLLELFLNDAQWREAELEFRGGFTAGLPGIEAQVAFMDRFAMRGSARDMLRIMDAAYTGDALAPEAQAVMREILNWPLDGMPANRAIYEALGVKDGAFATVFTSAWFVRPIGARSISLAVFYRNVPFDTWSDWIQTYEYQAVEIQAISTPDGCSIFEGIFDEE